MNKEDHAEYMEKMDQIIERSKEINLLWDDIDALMAKDSGNTKSHESINTLWKRLMAEIKDKEPFVHHPNIFKYDFGDKE